MSDYTPSVGVDATQQVFAGGQKVFGRYTLIKILGQGGMGVVWLARDEELERDVALKFLPEVIVHDRALLAELKSETKRSLELTHKNIVRIHDFVFDETSGCISMEYVDGETLSNLRAEKEQKVFEPSELAPLTAQLCEALDYAHNHARVIHRDLKPANLMVNRRGELKVSDFGIARSLSDTVSRLTREQGRSGTLVYMSPQQLEGEHGTHLDDIYSLGATLYDLLTSKPPFYSGNIDRQIHERVPPSMTERRKDLNIEPASVPAVWEEVVAACLEKDPAKRPQSAMEVAHRLQFSSAPVAARFLLRAVPRKAAVWAVAVVLICLVGFGTWYFAKSKLRAKGATPATSGLMQAARIAEKSIAVLPFENLSEEKANAFFADGVQDEILTDLARIADLKVISRTSVMPYKTGIARNLRQIAQELGVANVVEGSVQRAGNRVRVNAQLIDARTDKHLWGQTYDRDLADVFAVQSEIAKIIADQLQARLSPAETGAIERAPTTDIGAFDLYTRAKNILGTAPGRTKAELFQAVDLLNQAVAHDPSFFDAYCQLALAHAFIYHAPFDHTSTRLASADAAVEAAARLRPDAGETHLARAWNLYYGYQNYDRALVELEIARKTLPNDFQILRTMGYIQRRQGHWEESTRNIERAVELNPRDLQNLGALVNYNYDYLRRYNDGKSAFARALAIDPNNVWLKVWLAALEFDQNADTKLWHETLDSIVPTDTMPITPITEFQVGVALAERDATAAKNALAAHGENPLDFYHTVSFSRSFVDGLIARMMKDEGKARSAFTAARAEQEKIVQAQPNDSAALCVLGLIDAGLGRKEEALREGRRAVELTPIEKDAMDGVSFVANLAIIAAWVGDKDLAFEQLERIIRLPSDLSYGELKLMPWWDPLRGDPRFEKIVEDSKQPVGLEQVTQAAPDKSIAVLPFQNLSRDPDNAFFADGVQDEILTDLARIADLKVISRTSVTPYKSGIARNLRQIAQELGVTNVVEGSVQRAGNRVRVNAQLIDARTDKHLWGQTYDRDLADVFAIQSEIAKTIADQLQARLSPAEKGAIERAPTSDIPAFDLYARGSNVLLRANTPSGNGKADYLQAIDLLNQTVARDPLFFDAYCKLAEAHDALYFFGDDHTTARLALAEAAVQVASRLRPDAGETHLARAQNLYLGYRDYDGALAELNIARQTLPNDARVFRLSSLIQRRQGHWAESIRNAERSLELNPRDIELRDLTLVANYFACRHYAEGKAVLTRALALDPNDYGAKSLLAWVEFLEKADIKPLHQTIDSIRAANHAVTPNSAEDVLTCALAERDAVAAKDALDAFGENTVNFLFGFPIPRRFVEGVIARMAGDEQKAREAFTAARAEQEKTMQAQPNYAQGWSALGLIDAGLGRKEEALREGRRAVELLPVERDALAGVGLLGNLATIAAWVGDKDLAFEQLESIIRLPGGGSYGELKLMPMWDPLRGDPRFEKLLEESKQPVALK